MSSDEKEKRSFVKLISSCCLRSSILYSSDRPRRGGDRPIVFGHRSFVFLQSALSSFCDGFFIQLAAVSAASVAIGPAAPNALAMAFGRGRVYRRCGGLQALISSPT